MSNLLKHLYLFAAAAVLFTVAACGDDDDPIHYGGGSGGNTGGGSGSTTALAARMEVPALKDGNLFVSHWTTIGRDSVMTYCLEFDPAKYHSRWVAFRFDSKTRAKGAGRSEAWSDDPELPQNLRIGTEYFNGYSRGHICASYDRQYSNEANEQTFYMSNMSPQLSNFNGGLWQKLEAYVQGIGRDAVFADTLYVVKGGTIEEGQINTYVQRNRGMKVPVPKYYFMALLKVKNNTYSAVAFCMEHRNYSGAAAEDYASHAVSIDELEELTGIDFFPNLPNRTEEVVEATFDRSSWQL